MMFAQDSTLVGDVDCSGEVNSQDASIILQFVTNVIDSLPCEANMTGLTPEQLQEMIDMMEDQLSINYTGGSGGGFDIRYPDGFIGTENVYNDNTTFTVPAGKNLYITSHNSGSPSINGINFPSIGYPLIATEGDEVTNSFYGFLVDKTVTPISFQLSYFDQYPENIETVNSFVACTPNFERNTLLSAYPS